MIPVKDAAQIIEVTPNRLKQIIKENKFKIHKESNGFLKLPNETMRQILLMRGASFTCRIIVIGMQKGGVGKTALTLNAAIGAARRGFRVLIVDFDPEVCATRFLAPEDVNLDMLGSIYEVFHDGGLIKDYVVPSRFDGVCFLPSKPKMRRIERSVGGKNPKYLLKEKMKGLEEEFDLIFFDLPPAFNTMESAAYLSSDLVICPLDEDVFSIDSFAMTVEDIHEVCEQFDVSPPPIKLLRNKTTSEDRISYKETYEELMKDHGDKLLPFFIKSKAAVKNSINSGVSVFDLKGELDLKSSIGELVSYICPKFSLN